MFLPEKLYGVIGWPLGQSLSPLLHNSGFRALHMPAAYIAWPLPPEELKRFVQDMALYKVAGLSVTIPHKIAIMELLDNMSENAAMTGAVNTLFWRDGELRGDNTDVAGFLAPLKGLTLESKNALILGAGGAAHAVGAALRLSGCRQARVATPGNERQKALAERFGFTAIAWEERYEMPAQIVINATPLGMHGELARETPYDFALAPAVRGGIAYDLVYNPVRTRFLREAAAHGRRCIPGLEMFFGQGNAQFTIWTGKPLPPAARYALQNALGGAA